MPRTSFQKVKKALLRGKEAREKQLENEKSCFEEQNKKREENTDVCDGDQDGEDTDFFSINFSTPKELFTNTLRDKSKRSTLILVNVTRQNTKRLVKETFCSQQPTINDSFHKLKKKRK